MHLLCLFIIYFIKCIVFGALHLFDVKEYKNNYMAE